MKKCFVLLFTFQLLATIQLNSQCQYGGRVWYDINANGFQEANENGIQGISISLLNADSTIAMDNLGNPIPSSISDENGNYGFINLLSQAYLLQVNIENGYNISPLNIGVDNTKDSDYNEDGYLSKECTGNEIDLILDCGLYKNVTVGGTVWVEGDDNGNQDAGENGAAGIEVEIHDMVGNIVGIDSTDGHGDYAFIVKPGNYTIWVTENNFGLGNPLNGLQSCTPTEDPNNNVDMDDNGTGGNLGPIFTTNIELLCGSELGPEGTENFTLDFCFRYDCNATNGLAALSCETIIDTYCNLFDLDIGCARMPEILVAPFPSPLCPGGNNVANNMSWFAFVAGTGDYTLQVEPFECVPGGSGQIGLQAGIYTDCTFSDAVWCDVDCNIDVINISSSIFVPGNVYYFFFDGCAGSVCSYNINILGNFNEFIIPDPTSVICTSEDCTDVYPGTNVSVKVDANFDELKGTYYWVITDPMGVVSNVSTDVNELNNYVVDKLGTYTFTIDRIYTKCSETDIDQSITITVKNPNLEDFGTISECDDFFPPLGPTSVNNEGIITDPNGDGIHGWQGNEPLVEGLNVIHINNNGMEYDQKVNVIKLLNSEAYIDLVLCPQDLPFKVGGIEIYQEIILPTDIFTPNEAGCDSVIHLTAQILPDSPGQIDAVGCVPGGYLIKFLPDSNIINSNVIVDVIWKDANGEIVTDSVPDNDPNSIVIASEGIYHAEIFISYTVGNHQKECSYISNYVVVPQISQAIEIKLDTLQNIDQNNDFGFINISVIDGPDNLTFLWQGPMGFTSTSEDITNLIAGCYTVTVTDGYCSRTDTYCISIINGDQNLFTNQIIITPNPANNYINFNSLKEVNFIELFGVDGRLVKSSIIPNRLNFDFSVSDVGIGIYILKIYFQNEAIAKPISILR